MNKRLLEFDYEGKNAKIVFADEKIRTDKWVMKTEYFDAFPDTQNLLLERGINLAYIENETRWCKHEDILRKKRFADFLADEYGFNKKFGIIGMSCGGLIGTKFAAEFPERISVLYLDAPVLNLLSCPAGVGNAGNDMWNEFEGAMGISLSKLISYRENPIDKLDILVSSNIPVILVCGLSDNVVPYEENGEILYNFYKNNGGNVERYLKPGCGHHPHGLEDNKPIVDFMIKYLNINC